MEVLSDILRGSVNKLENSNNAAWVAFVKDHRKYLLVHSTEVFPDDSELFFANYSPSQLMMALKVQPALHWIVYYLNGLDLMSSLLDVRSIKLPDDKIVSDLYSSFVSYDNKFKNPA